MGNICHAGPVAVPTSEARALTAATKTAAPTFGRDPTLKREDYMFSNVKEPSVLVKLPGSINGQQFIIEDCSDCDIVLLDHCTSVQIDACVRCRIFVGPCQASLFVRSCSQCTVICAAQQFRTRDCTDVNTYMYCATEPIIETSTRMRFGCFPLAYFTLQQQFDRAKFSVWNNKWSEIYNFSPDHGAWKPLPAPSQSDSVLGNAGLLQVVDDSGVVTLWQLPVATAESLGFTAELAQLVVPLTRGVCASDDSASTVLVCFTTPSEQLMRDFVVAMVQSTSEALHNRNVQLIQTCQMKLSPAQAKELFRSAREQLQQYAERASEAAQDTLGSVMIEFQGPECFDRASRILRDEKFVALTSTHAVFLSPTDLDARRMRELVFQTWKPKV